MDIKDCVDNKLRIIAEDVDRKVTAMLKDALCKRLGVAILSEADILDMALACRLTSAIAENWRHYYLDGKVFMSIKSILPTDWEVKSEDGITSGQFNMEFKKY